MYCGSVLRKCIPFCAHRQSHRLRRGYYSLSAMSATAEDGVQKRPRAVKIGTHSGSFHCDEALGCYLLRKTAQFEGAPVTRSRDPEVWKDMDVLIDVGGEYHPERLRYDHHQRGFDEVFGHGFSTKLSSAGLVYKHHGKEIVAKFMNRPEADIDVQTVWLQVYKSFIEAVDAVDNGINQFDSSEEPRYLESTTLPSRVGHLNPQWNEAGGNELLDERFEQASALAGAEFDAALKRAATSWLPARAIVEKCLEAAVSVHHSGAIMELSPICPWKSHIYTLEEERGCTGRTLFVVFEDGRDGSWRVQAVNTSPASFELRHGLPEALRGLRGDELSAAAGIDGCVFVHAGGFIGGNKTRDGALAMARAALPA